VKTKFWIYNAENPQKGGVTRQDLLIWYNEFPFKKVYRCIKVEDLKLKPPWRVKISKRAASTIPEEFSIITEKMDDSGNDNDSIPN
jgi:hypothetical protein